MNISLSPRAWLILLAIDIVAFVLIALGLTLDVTALLVAGAVGLVVTSVVGVLARAR